MSQIGKITMRTAGLLLIGFLAGCAKPSAVISVKYTTGKGAVTGAFDKSQNLELSDTSFDGQSVVFKYRNMKDDAVGGWMFEVVVRTYTKEGTEVDTIKHTLYPGEVKIPCTGKIISIPTDTKNQKIARVEIEHIGKFSQSQFSENLDRRLSGGGDSD